MLRIYDVVDLGTKKGNAINEFLFRSGKKELGQDEIDGCMPSNCLGIDRPQAAAYSSTVESKGFKFLATNLATDEAIKQLPKSKVYLAWNFMEHVPDKQWAHKLTKAALTKASRLAWFRLPSFEQDIHTGEGVLKKHGMRFTWTNWLGHPNHWLVADCTQAIKDWQHTHPDKKFDLKIVPHGFINSMDDDRVVPADTPVDTNKYDPKFGPKPTGVKFKPPLIIEWDIIVRFL